MVVFSKLMPLFRRPVSQSVQKRFSSISASSWLLKKYAGGHKSKVDGPSPPFSTESILEFSVYYVIIPIILWARIHSYYVMKRESRETVEPPPRYEYLNINKRPLPWKDGKTPLFGWPRGRSPEEYVRRKELGLPMPDRLDDDIEDEEEEEEFNWDD